MVYLNEDPKAWIVLEEVDSTNSFLMREELPSGSVCLAHNQTKGRGRLNRKWLSYKGSSFLFSGLICTQTSMEELRYLPLLTGAAVLRALRIYIQDKGPILPLETQHLSFHFKWPNDIYLGSSKKILGKLCGILVESKTMGPPSKGDRHLTRIVIGVGLNWSHNKKMEALSKNMDTTSISGELDSFRPASLFHKPPTYHEGGQEVTLGPSSFAPHLLRCLNEGLRQWQAHERTFIEEIQENFYLRDQLLVYEGLVHRVQGLGNDGGLILEELNRGQQRILYSAEKDLELLDHGRWDKK